MNPYVKSVVPLEEYRLEIVFQNGERRVFDVRPYLREPAFAGLRNRAVFRAAQVVAGSVEWPGEVDLSYDTLYVDGRPWTGSEAQGGDSG